LSLELAWRSVPFEAQVKLSISYRGQPLSLLYRADFICFGTLLVEIKALTRLAGPDKAQVLNYLKASGLKRSLSVILCAGHNRRRGAHYAEQSQIQRT
jgi:GxxExxY protein